MHSCVSQLCLPQIILSICLESWRAKLKQSSLMYLYSTYSRLHKLPLSDREGESRHGVGFILETPVCNHTKCVNETAEGCQLWHNTYRSLQKQTKKDWLYCFYPTLLQTEFCVCGTLKIWTDLQSVKTKIQIRQRAHKSQNKIWVDQRHLVQNKAIKVTGEHTEVFWNVKAVLTRDGVPKLTTKVRYLLTRIWQK